jgi:hypothetical protein
MTAMFQSFQQDMARHLRDPRHTMRPAGVPARRMAVYNEMLFNNVCGFIDTCMPLSRKLLGDTAWRRLCRTFYRDWPLHTPWFREIPREFVRYLQEGCLEQPLPRWLHDLAHYEWAELAVDVMDVMRPVANAQGNLMAEMVVLNPARMDLHYDWAVHRIGEQHKPRKPMDTHLVVYRDADDAVQFTEVNAATAHVLALLDAQPMTGTQVMQHIAHQMQHQHPEQLLTFGASLLQQLQKQDIILGTQP